MLNQEEVIERFRKIHSDKYDYSFVNYSGIHNKVKIICPEHGEFFQEPHKHMRGSVCPKCNIDRQKLTTEDFIKKSREAHGDKFDYSKVKYINYDTKVEITCPIHGSFLQTPNNHFLYGCSRCGKDKLADYFSMTKENFIAKAKAIHGDKYTYENVNYINNTIKVLITCPIHGDFLQTPNGHLRGQGCRACSVERGIKKRLKDGTFGTSKEEKFLEQKLIELGQHFEKQYDADPRYPWCCDFYIPERDLFIEHNGFWVHQPEIGWYESTNKNHQKIKNNLEKNYSNWSPFAWWTSDVEKRLSAKNNNLNYVVLWNKKDIEDWSALGCPDGHDGDGMYTWRKCNS